MRSVLLFTAFLYSSFLIGQSILLPPENVTMAFNKQYPDKKAIWSMELGANDEIKFEAKFDATNKTKGFVIYDSNGVFKAYKTQILMSKLPLNTQKYLKKNYPAKSVNQILSVIDDENKATYIVAAKKDKKLYNIVFDKDGEFVKRTAINFI